MKSVIPPISVRNSQRKVPLNVADLERFTVKALKLCLELPRKSSKLTKLPEIAVWIVSDRRIAALHRKFMDEPGPTDVITFQHGEIFISAETARRHAHRFKNTLARELKLYIVHGLLHLQGFDDRDERGARAMRAVQSRILAKMEPLK